MHEGRLSTRFEGFTTKRQEALRGSSPILWVVLQVTWYTLNASSGCVTETQFRTILMQLSSAEHGFITMASDEPEIKKLGIIFSEKAGNCWLN